MSAGKADEGILALILEVHASVCFTMQLVMQHMLLQARDQLDLDGSSLIQFAKRLRLERFKAGIMLRQVTRGRSSNLRGGCVIVL
jgi:hypothetical protein